MPASAHLTNAKTPLSRLFPSSSGLIFRVRDIILIISAESPMPTINEEQRQHIIALLENGESLPAEFKTVLFPPERQEYELAYVGKEREEDIIAETMAVPLQPIRTFGGNGVDWHNMLIFGDNLQAMKTLLQMKERGQLVNADGTSGFKLVYIDPPFA